MVRRAAASSRSPTALEGDQIQTVARLPGEGLSFRLAFMRSAAGNRGSCAFQEGADVSGPDWVELLCGIKCSAYGWVEIGPGPSIIRHADFPRRGRDESTKRSPVQTACDSGNT